MFPPNSGIALPGFLVSHTHRDSALQKRPKGCARGDFQSRQFLAPIRSKLPNRAARSATLSCSGDTESVLRDKSGVLRWIQAAPAPLAPLRPETPSTTSDVALPRTAKPPHWSGDFDPSQILAGECATKITHFLAILLEGSQPVSARRRPASRRSVVACANPHA